MRLKAGARLTPTVFIMLCVEAKETEGIVYV